MVRLPVQATQIDPSELTAGRMLPCVQRVVFTFGQPPLGLGQPSSRGSLSGLPRPPVVLLYSAM